MQYTKLKRIAGLFAGLVIFAAGTSTALAVGTPSGTNITNTATVNYTVGGDARSGNGSDPGFVVDNRVDLTVANTDAGNNVNVTPGVADRVLTYTVTNTGNTTQGYLLSAVAATANIPMGNVRIYLDDGNGSWDGTGTETLYTAGNNAFDLDPNGAPGADTTTVFIVADTPAAAADTNQDDYRLVATTTAAGGVGAPAVALGPAAAPTAGVDVVFADAAGDSDAARDGQHSDAATYTVVSANLTVAKTILSTTDEFGGSYSLPNATVVYQVVVTNGGAGTVDNNTVTVSDPVPAGTRACYQAGTTCAGAPTFAAGTSGLTLFATQYSDDNGGTWTYAPTDPDGDGADPAITDVRWVTTGTMNATSDFTVTFGVVIN
jgi:uncharacterized repeat protein (TIGR01451 family)